MPGIVGAPDLVGTAIYSGAGTLEEASSELFKIGTEVTVEHLALTLVSVFIVSFGLFSGFIKEKLYIGEAIIATVIGILFSGYVGGVFSPRSWAEGQAFDDITLELTRVVIALSVFAVGVELPKAYIARHWRSLSILLGPVMLFGWIVSGALIYALIPGLNFLPSLVVAAGLSPTDPILASSVVGKGKFAQDHVPSHLRHLLQAESGANDGAAFPFLYLALFLLLRDYHTPGEAVGYWFLLVILYQIVLGISIGAVIGIIARKLLKFSKRRKLIDRESMVALYVSLAFLVTGLTTLTGSDDLLAAFACGTAFAWDDWFTESIEDSNFSSIIDLLVNSLIFIYLGATMPFAAWNDASLTLTPWRLVILSILILALKRLPIIFVLHRFIPDIKTRREAIFCGHFGPVGVGALFISTLAASKLPTPRIPPQDNLDLLSLTIQPITYFIILSSVLVHGLTISFFSLGRRVHSRVQSISRTFTQASGTGEEPSWMSRVKRVTNIADIVINRDDDDESEDLAEKGDLGKQQLDNDEVEEEKGDTGLLAMFGAPSSGNSSSGTAAGSTSSLDKKEEESEKQRGDNDEHPSENVLGDNKTDRDHHIDKEEKDDSSKENLDWKVKSRDFAKRGDQDEMEEGSGREAQYCRSDEETTWNEGQQIVIDRKDEEEVEVIDLHPTNPRIESAKAHPAHSLITVPPCAIEQEKKSLDREGKPVSDESAVKRFIQRRRAGSIAQAVAKIVGVDDLTSEQREERRRDKLARDAWCRKETHYRDKDGESEIRSKGAQEWREGNKIVTVRGDEDIEVRDMSAAEREARAATHLAALKKLGRPIEKVEAELLKLTQSRSKESDSDTNSNSSKKGKGKESSSRSNSPPPVRSTGTGLALTRTSRVVEDDEEEEEDEEDWQDDEIPAPSPSTSRPNQLPRANSRVRAMRDAIFHPHRTPDRTNRGRLDAIDSSTNSRSSSPGRASIRFAVPTRDEIPSTSGTNGGRPFPAVGGLGIKRELTK